MEALRVGVLGCGRITQRIHLPILRRMRGVRLAALGDVDPALLTRVAASAPGCSTHSSAESMWSEADIDAVLIALPSGQLAQTAAAALQRGLHVYVEKPVAVDLEQADGLVEAARRSQRTFRVGLNFRFHPGIRELRRSIRTGEFGAVVGVQTCFASPSRDLPEWKRKRATGGGALLDLGVHHFDLLTFLLDARPREVVAGLRTLRTEHDVADVTLRFGEVDAQVMVALGAAQTDRIEILGTAGRARWDRFACPAPERFPEQRDHTLGGRLRELRGGLARSSSLAARLLRPRGEPSYALALGEFVRSARDGATDGLAATAQVGRDALAIVLAAEEAAVSGRPVSL